MSDLMHRAIHDAWTQDRIAMQWPSLRGSDIRVEQTGMAFVVHVTAPDGYRDRETMVPQLSATGRTIVFALDRCVEVLMDRLANPLNRLPHIKADDAAQYLLDE
jgi:hypothetical protein